MRIDIGRPVSVHESAKTIAAVFSVVRNPAWHIRLYCHLVCALQTMRDQIVHKALAANEELPFTGVCSHGTYRIDAKQRHNERLEEVRIEPICFSVEIDR